MVDRAETEDFLSPCNLASALFFESPSEIFLRVHREIRPRTDPPSIDIEFRCFANPDSRIRLQEGHLRLSITDMLENAPAPVIEALAHILLAKLYRKPVGREYAHRYRLYFNRRDVRRQIQTMRRQRGRKVHNGSVGAFYNLVEIFEDLNLRYFGGTMPRPELGWSNFRSRTRLGHFDPSHNIIIISRIFDDARTPRIALEYVMFHEVLHLRYPVDHSRIRRCLHTPEFKAHEKQFPHFREAKALLKKMW